MATFEEGSLPTATKYISLDQNALMDIGMSITFTKNNEQQIPLYGVASQSGFISGFEWRLTSMNITENKDDNLRQYAVSGLLKWNLFGINLYTQSKHFNGILE
ncbi:hypothetical protein M0D21_00420 [Aquimarina sp. D1M17]|uniref:hypothetical protein n=1 Tax=Aquimarina acroporae TaxID=2937283 RepID=UPI0020C142F2|nr:hypothetical protein [Aquimarina acroporae]MCK8520013.1 hypothetical protein [Aquimarina acroporae]